MCNLLSHLPATTSSPQPSSQLEKYSTNLEAVVAERTMELAAEKAKTEELVCRMLIHLFVLVLKITLSVSLPVCVLYGNVLTVSIPGQCLNLYQVMSKDHMFLPVRRYAAQEYRRPAEARKAGVCRVI